MMSKILSSKQAQAFRNGCMAIDTSGGWISVCFEGNECETFVKLYSEGDVMITRISKDGEVKNEEYTSLEAFEEAYTFLL